MNDIMSINPEAFIAEGAKIIGNVTVMENASIWYNSVVRSDMPGAKIIIGKNTNVQDGTVVHTDYEKSAIIGDNVTIGHNCTIHACIIEDDCLIGMGAVILSGAVIKKGSVVAAGAVVTENSVIESGVIAAGTPAKKIKELPERVKSGLKVNLEYYVKLAAEHKSGKFEMY